MGRIRRSHTGKQIACEEMVVTMIKRSTIQKSKARILVVDDEPRVAKTLRDLLVLAGFDVKIAQNGKQAMRILKSPAHFDLLITDMKMPEMDGLELLRLAHEVNKTLPVVVLTGCGTVENGINALEEGAHDYVLKPFNTEKLLLVVWQALKNFSSGVPTA